VKDWGLFDSRVENSGYNQFKNQVEIVKDSENLRLAKADTPDRSKGSAYQQP